MMVRLRDFFPECSETSAEKYWWGIFSSKKLLNWKFKTSALFIWNPPLKFSMLSRPKKTLTSLASLHIEGQWGWLHLFHAFCYYASLHCVKTIWCDWRMMYRWPLLSRDDCVNVAPRRSWVFLMIRFLRKQKHLGPKLDHRCFCCPYFCSRKYKEMLALCASLKYLILDCMCQSLDVIRLRLSKKVIPIELKNVLTCQKEVHFFNPILDTLAKASVQCACAVSCMKLSRLGQYSRVSLSWAKNRCPSEL